MASGKKQKGAIRMRHPAQRQTMDRAKRLTTLGDEPK